MRELTGSVESLGGGVFRKQSWYKRKHALLHHSAASCHSWEFQSVRRVGVVCLFVFFCFYLSEPFVNTTVNANDLILKWAP